MKRMPPLVLQLIVLSSEQTKGGIPVSNNRFTNIGITTVSGLI